MSTPAIVMPETGLHNRDLAAATVRLAKGQGYRDLSTVWVCPTRGGRSLPSRAVGSWIGLIRPMNQQVVGPLFLEGMEVGEAYNAVVSMVLANPTLAKFRYLLTVEDDNLPPPDGLLKLYEAIEGQVDGQKYDAVGGLYWTKGEGGQPMIYGDPNDLPLNFRPQIPRLDTVQRANGLGMGFNLFRLAMFKKLDPPWFKTLQEYTPGVGAALMTQDLYFYQRAGAAGYRFACDTRVKVGHLDAETGMVW